ncbi:MAG: DUF998 domain-containing protein [Pseudomonadota bacterium]
MSGTYYFRIALYAGALTPMLHVLVLILSGQDPISTPISQLSQGKYGDLHALGLALFGAAHFAMALGFRRIDRGRMWPWARIVLVFSGLAVWYIAGFYKEADPERLLGPEANDPLWIAACLTGVAMGMLQPGLSRRSKSIGLFSAVCLGLWFLLIPLILLVNDSWIGAYERVVGFVYVTWVVGISYAILHQHIEPYPKPPLTDTF